MRIFGDCAGGMEIMRIVAGYVLYDMMFWFGPERVE
jgi:hypothetical protein